MNNRLVSVSLSSRAASRVVLLSRINSPFLDYMIQALANRDIPIDSIIFDSQMESAKEQGIHEERTKGRFPLLPLHEFEDEYIRFFFV